MDRRDKDALKSSLGAFLRVLCDLMILNVVWIVCCLPIVTFGPASSALARVMVNLARDGSATVLKDYFAAFRRDFGKAVVLGLLGLLGVAVVASDYRFAVTSEGAVRTLFLIVAILAGGFVASYLAYVFPLHAFYENSLSGHIKNALALAATAPVETVLIWLCFAVPIAAFLLLPAVVIVYLGFLYILFGASAPAYFAARRQAKVLARFGGAPAAAEDKSEE